LKYGWITDDKPRKPLPNISARLIHQFTTLVGDELGKVQNPNSLIAHTRSTERGLITNLENQTRVWKRMLDLLGVVTPVTTDAARYFGWNIAASRGKARKTSGIATARAEMDKIVPVPAHSLAVILLLPPHCPRLLLDQILQIWFEDFGVGHVGLGISTVCASYNQIHATSWKTSCTVDMGWSSTLIVPTFRGRPIQSNSIRRLPVGGRQMINMLKYYMSYRQYNLMDQTHLMREVFENLCYLSLDAIQDLALARQKPSGRRMYDRDFVLPDYQRTYHGEIRIPLALQKDLEREAQKAQGEGTQDEDDDEDDEDFEEIEDADSDDGQNADCDDHNLEINDQNEDDNKGKKKRSKDKNWDGEGSDEADDEEEEEEEETLEQKRKRILQVRAQEERRKRQQEEEEQVLRVSLERFAVPEVLFRPMDAGLMPDLVGLAQSIVQSVEACPPYYRPALYQSIYLVGGVSRLENLISRLERELRSLIISEYDMKILLADSPIDQAWIGARHRFSQEPYNQWSISRQEWEAVSKRKAYAKLLLGNGGSFL
jgi:actin-related protein